MLKEDIKFIGPVKGLSQVEEAQQRIVAVIRNLDEAGEIMWEGVIKIQSSYKIIKKDYVSLLKDDPSLIDTRLDLPAVGLGYKSNGKKPSREDVSTDNGKNGRSQDLDREREALMEEIMAEAQVIKEKARADGHREGYDKGYKEGVKQGIDKGRLEGLEQGYMEGLKKADQEAERIRQSAIKMLQQAQDELDNYIDENR